MKNEIQSLKIVLFHITNIIYEHMYMYNIQLSDTKLMCKNESQNILENQLQTQKFFGWGFNQNQYNKLKSHFHVKKKPCTE